MLDSFFPRKKRHLAYVHVSVCMFTPRFRLVLTGFRTGTANPELRISWLSQSQLWRWRHKLDTPGSHALPRLWLPQSLEQLTTTLRESCVLEEMWTSSAVNRQEGTWQFLTPTHVLFTLSCVSLSGIHNYVQLLHLSSLNSQFIPLPNVSYFKFVTQ